MDHIPFPGPYRVQPFLLLLAELVCHALLFRLLHLCQLVPQTVEILDLLPSDIQKGVENTFCCSSI